MSDMGIIATESALALLRLLDYCAAAPRVGVDYGTYQRERARLADEYTATVLSLAMRGETIP